MNREAVHKGEVGIVTFLRDQRLLTFFLEPLKQTTMEVLATNISMILVIKNLRLSRIFPFKGSSVYENFEEKIPGREILRIFFLPSLYASSFS